MRQRQSRRPRLAWRDSGPDLYRPHQGRPHRARRQMDHRAGIADHDRHRRPLGFRLPRQRQGDGAHHREGEDRQRRRLHRVPAEPRRTSRRLSADGDAGGHDRDSHRRFRPLTKARRPVRRTRGAAWHQPDLDRGALRSRRAVLSGHGDLGCRRRKDPARGRPRRGDSDRLDHRRRGTPHHRSYAIPQGRRAASARRHRGLQGQRPRRDGRGALWSAHRARLRRRADRAAQ